MEKSFLVKKNYSTHKEISSEEGSPEPMIKKNVLEFDENQMSGKKEVVHFENGQIVSRILGAPTGEKTYKYSDNELVEFAFNREHADITYKKTSRQLEYNSADLNFVWNIPYTQLTKISDWIINDLQGELTFYDGHEEVFFKSGELVIRVVGPEGFFYKYQEGRLVKDKEETMSEKKNLLDICRSYSFPSEYFGAEKTHSEKKVFINDGWQVHKNGLLHSEKGPAQVQRSDPPEYYLGGQKLSKEEWLCLTDPEYRGDVSFGIENDEVKFFKEGELHREFGPAVLGKDGNREWYKEGKLHREDGPALITYDDTKWAIDGQSFNAHCA